MMRPSIVLIVVDCLRKDYAHHLERELERYDFVIYNNVWSVAPWTIPSVVSLLTGLYPSAHGVHETSNVKVPAIRVPMYLKNLMLHNNISQLGYRTVLLSSNPFISSEFGISSFHLEENILFVKQRPNIRKFLLGFNRIVVEKLLRYKSKQKTCGVNNIRGDGRKARESFSEILLKIIPNKLDKGCTYLLKRAFSILKHCSGPMFIYIHLMEPHEPYPTIDSQELFTWQYVNIITGRISHEVLRKIQEGYRREVEYVTNKLIEFIEKLDKNKLLDQLLIIVTSDHGQLLGEDNLILHGIYLRDELLRVPLAIHYPKDVRVKVLSPGEPISLTKVKDLVLQIASGKEQICDWILSCNTVFAESWGIHHDLEYFRRHHGISDRIKLIAYKFSRVEELEKHRVFVVSERFKAIVNVSDNVVERCNYLSGTNYSSEEILNVVNTFLKQSLRIRVRLRIGGIGRVA